MALLGTVLIIFGVLLLALCGLFALNPNLILLFGNSLSANTVMFWALISGAVITLSGIIFILYYFRRKKSNQ